jgi:hypothetical protein
MRRACGFFEVARFLCGFELIAREHQKLFGVTISVIGLMLVDFPFSKKPVRFFSKPDVFSGVVAESFSQLAAHSHPFVCSEIIDRAVNDFVYHGESKKRNKKCLHSFDLVRRLRIFLSLNRLRYSESYFQPVAQSSAIPSRA